MRLTTVQTLVILLAVAAGTQITRWLPFVLFPEHREPPKVVAYLGRVLPPAMMGLLVVYCLRSVDLLSGRRCICGSATCCCPSPAARRYICCWSRRFLCDRESPR